MTEEHRREWERLLEKFSDGEGVPWLLPITSDTFLAVNEELEALRRRVAELEAGSKVDPVACCSKAGPRGRQDAPICALFTLD